MTPVTPAASAAAEAAVKVAASLGVRGTDPVILADGANVIVTVWYALYTERLPRLRSRAAELLALWPAP